MSQDKLSILIPKVLTGEASPEELADFQLLIAENQEWKSYYQSIEELWNSKEDVSANQVATEEAYLLHLGRLKDEVNDFDHDTDLVPHSNEDFQLYPLETRWYKKWQTYALASVFLLVSLFSFRIFKNTDASTTDSARHVNEINVNPGAKTKLQLPDGSHVWVNSDSKLSYSETFKGALREVFLEGEAYFDVVKDPAHPFIVHTSGIDIKVLGTAFNVKAYKSEQTIEATLIHGMIEVTKNNQPNAPKVILKPHEKMIFDKLAEDEINIKSQPGNISGNTAASLPKTEKPAIVITPLAKNIADTAIMETAWVYNRLIFEDEKFDDLAVKMERWFDVKISINNEKLKAYRITGSFENETIEEALKELQYLVSFGYKITGRDIVINKK